MLCHIRSQEVEVEDREMTSGFDESFLRQFQLHPLHAAAFRVVTCKV